MDTTNSVINDAEWPPEEFEKDMASVDKKAKGFSIEEMYKAARRAEPIIRRMEEEEASAK